MQFHKDILVAACVHRHGLGASSVQPCLPNRIATVCTSLSLFLRGLKRLHTLNCARWLVCPFTFTVGSRAAPCAAPAMSAAPPAHLHAEQPSAPPRVAPAPLCPPPAPLAHLCVAVCAHRPGAGNVHLPVGPHAHAHARRPARSVLQ